MQNFLVETLAATAVLEAWPLVHLALPGVDLAAWRRAARRRAASGKPGRPRTGILVARRGIRRQICGMVWYRSEVDLALGRILRARHLLAVDILDVTPIITALLNQLGPIAKALNCTTIRLAAQDDKWQISVPAHAMVPLQLHATLDHWLDIGFSTDLLCRNVARLTR